MAKSMLVVCLLSAALLTPFASANAPSPYSGQDSREIKALSSDEVQAYLAGKGMGLAKAAELNGYPGPLHGLPLSSELGLTTNQKERTERLFAAMQSRAKALGHRLVEEEQRLDQLFASRTITKDSLARTLARIGELAAQLREVHLETHLAQVEILTPAQVEKYMALRGYTNVQHTEGHRGHGR